MNYYIWRAWRLSGGAPDARPVLLPARIPPLTLAHWYVRLAAYKALHPKPAPVVRVGPWRSGRILYMTGSALPTDGTLQPEADLLAFHCATLAADGKPKFASVAFQVSDTSDTTARRKAAAIKSACYLHGLHFLIWAQAPKSSATALVAGFTPEAYIANVEGPNQGNPETLSVPAIVCTTAGGLGDNVHAWIAAGYDCQPEVYTVENPVSTIPREVYQQISNGWPADRIFPVVGVYHNYPLSLYGVGWNAVYLNEGMQPSDWDF